METPKNQYGQPVGEPLQNWKEKAYPEHRILKGKYCTLVPTNRSHSDQLFEAHCAHPADWTYLPYGPFATPNEFAHYIAQMEKSRDPLHFTVLDRQGRAVGTLALMRIRPEHGVMEVGHVVFSNALKKTFMATEAHYLLMKETFETLGYRRYEWKCDSLNAPSRNAAQRLGFKFEGIFRQDIVYRSRSRDTAWFSILDKEWPDIKKAMQNWLGDENQQQGQQVKKLSIFMPNPSDVAP